MADTGAYGRENAIGRMGTPAAPPTVFIVDDDIDVRAAIAGLLKSVGLDGKPFEVRTRLGR